MIRAFLLTTEMSSVTLHVTPSSLSIAMRIRNVIHKGLRNFIEEDNSAGLQPAVINKLRKIVTFLQDMEHEDELRNVLVWKAHQLTGNKKGMWSLFVTKNWRITFEIDKNEIEIFDLNYEDYH